MFHSLQQSKASCYICKKRLEEIEVCTMKQNPIKKINFAKEDINIQPFVILFCLFGKLGKEKPPRVAVTKD